ncbi:MAG: ABC transporter permease subunit [Wenzhouxiangellaceae bacterium]
MNAARQGQRPLRHWHWLALIGGYSFLYLPIALLVLYSFNASALVAVWGGFSWRWYAELIDNRSLLDALWVSLRIAVASATLATFLGTLAGLALARMGRFRGRSGLAAMLIAPLVMPEVVTGLALLLSFVAISLNRGLTTVVLAHTTFSLCYVALLVESRLNQQNDELEQAALDLGCTPAQAFMRITLPLMLPAVVSGWLLALTLSLDDLVIASFTSGPGASTLPMKIYSAVRLGVSPQINALSTLIIGTVALGLWLSWKIQKSRGWSQ